MTKKPTQAIRRSERRKCSTGTLCHVLQAVWTFAQQKMVELVGFHVVVKSATKSASLQVAKRLLLCAKFRMSAISSLAMLTSTGSCTERIWTEIILSGRISNYNNSDIIQ